MLCLDLTEAMMQSDLWEQSEYIVEECSSIICASVVLGGFLGTI